MRSVWKVLKGGGEWEVEETWQHVAYFCGNEKMNWAQIISRTNGKWAIEYNINMAVGNEWGSHVIQDSHQCLHYPTLTAS
jgi:hypothetical protein